MHNVYDCVEAFEKLLDKEYHLELGRKNTAVSLQINFDNHGTWDVDFDNVIYWQSRRSVHKPSGAFLQSV